VAIGNFTTVALDHGIGVMNPGGILFAPDRVIQMGGWRCCDFVFVLRGQGWSITSGELSSEYSGSVKDVPGQFVKDVMRQNRPLERLVGMKFFASSASPIVWRHLSHRGEPGVN
jgi:hypothetical protein